MPNIKSAKKRVKQTEQSRLRNVARKSAVKTAVRKVLTAIEDKDVALSQELLKDAQAKLSRAKGKGLLHRNTVARRTSKLAQKVAAIAKEAAGK